MQGKIAYQADPHHKSYYVRKYDITGDTLSIDDSVEGPFGPEILPTDILKQVK